MLQTQDAARVIAIDCYYFTQGKVEGKNITFYFTLILPTGFNPRHENREGYCFIRKEHLINTKLLATQNKNTIIIHGNTTTVLHE